MTAISVRNPRTGARDYTIEPPDAAQLDALTARLRAAQPGWAALPVERRVETMRAFAAALTRHRAAIEAALILDTGRKRESLVEFESLAGLIERWANWAPAQLAEYADRDTAVPFLKLSGQLVPYPLVGVISPWNFPLLLSMIDAIPALFAGSAAIVKPSEVTPRFIAPVTAAIAEVEGLRDVFAYVAGDGVTGAAVIDRSDMVVFTGSVPTGRKVAAQAAARFIPAFLELGGKDPAIVLAGSDLDRAASALLWGSTNNCGHACQSIERIYVQRPDYERFVETLAKKANAIRLALPETDSGELGPVIFDKQAEIIRAQLDDALAKGATMVTGQGVEEHDGGYYVRATVLTGVDHSMAIMREETFGPIMPVMPFDTVDEAVELANDTEFGLSAAVFGPTEEAAEAVGRRIDAGGISVNDSTLTGIMMEGEKMSFGASGLGGSRMGASGIRRFLRQKVLIKSRNTGHNPWWYKPTN